MRGNTANLRPFDSKTASDAGKRSALARQTRRALDTDATTALRRNLDHVASTFQRETLGTDAAAVAGLLLARLAAGEIVVRRGDEAAALLRALVDIARLEAGEATNLTMVGHVSTVDAIARVNELRDRARAVLLSTSIVADATELSASALAADDPPVVEGVPIVGDGGSDPAELARGVGLEDGGVGQ